MSHLDLTARGSGHASLMALGVLAQRLGGMPLLRESTAPETRYGALMRSDQDNNPDAPALVAWAVSVNDQDDWTPPESRGPAVAAARLWASRSRWGKPALGVAAAALFAVMGALGVERIQTGLAEREAARQAQQLQVLRQQLVSARTWFDVSPALQPAVAEVLEPTIAQARTHLADAEAALVGSADPDLARTHLGSFDALRAQLQSWSRVSAAIERVGQVQIPEAHAALRARLDARLQQALSGRNATEALDAANAIVGLPQTLAQFEDRPRADGPDAEAKAALEAARARTDAGLAEGRLSLATSLLAAERELVRAINQAYTVRLVDRPGEKPRICRRKPARRCRRLRA